MSMFVKWAQSCAGIRSVVNCTRSWLKSSARHYTSKGSPPATKLSPARSQVKSQRKWIFEIEEFMFKNLRPDKVPEGYKMVYRSSLEHYVNFSILIGNATGIFLTPYLVKQLWDGNLSETDWAWPQYEQVLTTMAIYSSVAVLYFIVLRCPLRIYFSEAQSLYLLKIPRMIPYKTSSLLVKPGSMTPPAASKSNLPWKHLEHRLKDTGAKLIIIDSSFSLPMYYNHLMGFSKLG